MLVDKIMTKRVVSVELDDTLRTVKHIFEQGSFHHLLAVEKGKLYGVLSDRDLLKAISPRIGTLNESAQDIATLNKKVHQVMSRKPVSIAPDTNVYQAISLFNQHRISCLPVVDDNNHPVGILSWRDVFRAIEDTQNKKKK
jgi:acetoin utilization protein AcuB